MIYALSIITNYINVKNKKTAKKWRMTLIPFAIYCFMWSYYIFMQEY